MQNATTLKEYRKELQHALDDNFLRATMDAFAVAYRGSHEAAFQGLDIQALIAEVATAKDYVIQNMEPLYQQFKAQAEKNGVKVHLARTAREANEIITAIAKENNCKRIIKSKSMTAEETLLNHVLEDAGYEVVETDLGEWIIQLRHEGPSHMVMPAIHLSRHQVADLFSTLTDKREEPEIKQLVKVARQKLRHFFAEADMGISGANFAIAETGTIGIFCNEGNARLTMTLPRVHVALCGLDKLAVNLHDALGIARVLPKNATGQAITSYVNLVTGATPCAIGENGKKIMHIVFLDNGRTALAKDPVCNEVLRCVRCGACANVCPVYRLVGGHNMGHIYIGAIGLILTYFYHGRDKARQLIQNCINCGACKEICAAGIDLPAVIQEIRARLIEEEGSPIEGTLLAKVMTNRKLFHTLLRFAKWAQKPITGNTPYLRHLPQMFARGQEFRALPAIADKPFRDIWPRVQAKNKSTAKIRVGIFAGCAQDFIYPEQIEAAAALMQAKGVALDFPMEQSCCGLPVQMMGERKAAEDVAIMNVRAFDAAQYDYIVTMCASCASHIKHSYPRLLRDFPNMAVPTEQFTSRVTDLSSFLHDVLGYTPEDFNKSTDKVAYHAPCHLCRGLGVTKQPRALIDAAGEYAPTSQEDVCCGFGGSYSVKFPEMAAATLKRKLDNYEASAATTLVTDCPGCVMQLRGGEAKRSEQIKVEHIAEFLARQLKQK